jgi:hypothetical protein
VSASLQSDFGFQWVRRWVPSVGVGHRTAPCLTCRLGELWWIPWGSGGAVEVEPRVGWQVGRAPGYLGEVTVRDRLPGVDGGGPPVGLFADQLCSPVFACHSSCAIEEDLPRVGSDAIQCHEGVPARACRIDVREGCPRHRGEKVFGVQW